MKSEFIHKGSNSRLILIFAGWSAGPDLFRHIGREGWDTLVVYDFSDFTFDDSLLRAYDTVWLVAWSLGVCAAELLLDPSLITSAIAVNGSLLPVDDGMGIPTAIYDGTADTLDRRNLIKFRNRMAGDSAVFKAHFDSDPSQEEIESLRRQLYIIREKTSGYDPKAARLPWRRAFVSENDRIFPASNLSRCWETAGVEQVTIPEGNHYVDLASLIDTILPDPERVGQKFSEAARTYESSASAQRQIAGRLLSLIPERPSKGYETVLEIGSGSGLLSRMVGDRFAPRTMHFVDLAPCEKLDVAPEERYFAADAEDWIKECDSSYDLIVSSSTFQWFANLPLFLKNCRRILNPGGVVAFSTFLPGNLGELDALRPSPIIYTEREKLEKYLADTFSETDISQEDICVYFNSARELLMHLKNTGVAGSAPSHRLNLSSFNSIDTLTYRPVYCICR